MLTQFRPGATNGPSKAILYEFGRVSCDIEEIVDVVTTGNQGGHTGANGGGTVAANGANHQPHNYFADVQNNLFRGMY